MPCLKPPKREGKCAPSARKGRCWVTLHWAGTARATSPLDGDARTCTTEPEETKHPILQRRRLIAERSNVRGWQDLRAVHDSGARAAKRGPSWQDLRAVRSRKAVCGAFRMHGAHILPEPAHFRIHGARNLPRTGDFPVRGHFWDARSEKIATDDRPGMHRGGILPRQGTRERTARVYCHCQSGQERIRAQSCHGWPPGNAFREHFAIVERPGNAYS